MKILVSAGETSGDRYAAELVDALRRRYPDAEFFGSAGPRLRAAGVEPIVRTESLAVVGLFEVVRHIPRIYGEFRRLLDAARSRRPDIAILTDAPDFNLRVAAKLRKQGCPVVYYVAPQVWAWRQWRVKRIRRLVDELLCIFPFEERFFQDRGVKATFVGHPLTAQLRPDGSRKDFCARHGLDPNRPVVALLPGSRTGEAARHLPDLLDAVERLQAQRPVQALIAVANHIEPAFFRERIGGSNVLLVENDTPSALAHADAAFVASGTATVEAALLECPMVVFYRVSAATWKLGKPLVKVPFYSMVNLLAEREIARELIQDDCKGERLAEEMERLLGEPERRLKMKRELAEIRQKLAGDRPAAEKAAEVVCERLGRKTA